MVKLVVSLQPMENDGGADIHTEGHGGLHAGEGGHALKETTACGEKPMPPHGPGRSCRAWMNLWTRPMLEQFLKNFSWWEGHMLQQFVKDCIL